MSGNAQMRPDGPRDEFAGPENGPEAPFPVRISGLVKEGFGRGSKELNIATANLPLSSLSAAGHDDLGSGIYFGFAGLENKDLDGNPGSTSSTEKGVIYQMAMSLGYNPHYGNTERSIEVHLMHDIGKTLYGVQLRVSILGFIRPEYKYKSTEDLIADINMDIKVARQSLDRKAWKEYAQDPWLLDFE